MTGPGGDGAAAGGRGGGPAVLLCAGMGDGVGTWDAVAPLLGAAGWRVARLDRPGLGALPDDGAAPTLAGEVARIDAGVAGLGRPVLVAHSAAALPAEAYARLHPGRLAGLVLVDPSVVVEQPAWVRVARWSAGAVAGRASALGGFLDRSGLAVRVGPWAWERAVRRMSVRPPDRALGLPYASGSALARVLVEWLAYPSMAAELVEVRRRTAAPALPVRVLTALGDVTAPAGRTAWRGGHDRLAGSFPAGRHEVFRDARHLLHSDHPEVVVRAVTAVGRDGGS
ncbi:alpha/beta hydrolase [Micromonospora sp. CPCC 205711]|uniref:alpha/beta fold hydrolase n=1 Tax=Micromonospora sp. CPCC 205547 TaxID=3122400 RepID=UPI002FEF5138